MLSINNRRYIGGKKKIVPYIKDIIHDFFPDIRNLLLADLFAGTGVVAYEFAKEGMSVIVNDLLP